MIRRFKRFKVKKGDILQREGELNTKVFHVKSGLLRSYAIDKNGKENIFMFAPDGWVIADHSGPEVPAVLFIDALEDSEVIELPKDTEREKKNIVPLTKRLGALQNRILMLISTNAIERYENFVRMYPSLVQRVPQRMIASYLGVTPERLSAAKSKRRKKTK
ncbi:MAG: Crp/Fnr family transcriptional regulator [Bacteroidota bacterium]